LDGFLGMQASFESERRHFVENAVNVVPIPPICPASPASVLRKLIGISDLMGYSHESAQTLTRAPEFFVQGLPSSVISAGSSSTRGS